MTVSWPAIFGTFASFFFVFNLLFALVYSLQPDDVANLNPPGYWGRFFFSVETLATVGYGDMHPQTMFAHIIASFEFFTGMMSLALITGMLFARFSRPTARFMFARYARHPAARRTPDADDARRQCASEHRHGSLGAVAADPRRDHA